MRDRGRVMAGISDEEVVVDRRPLAVALVRVEPQYQRATT